MDGTEELHMRLEPPISDHLLELRDEWAVAS